MKNFVAAILIVFLFHLTVSGYQAKVTPVVDDERLQATLWIQTSLQRRALPNIILARVS